MTRKKFCLRWYYNWSNCYLFVNGTEIHKFKAKESETNPISLCTGNHLKDFFVDNLKKIEFYGYIYGFSVDYDALAVDDILGIHKNLMKTNDIIQNFWIIEESFFTAMTFFGWNVLNVNPLKCVAMNNQTCKVRPEVINVNGNEPLFYPYSIEINKCSASFNNKNDPNGKLCVPDVFKHINAKLFNLMPRTNKTRHTE